MRPFGRANNVGEQDSCQHAIVLQRLAYTSEEFFNLIENRIRIAKPRQMVYARQFDILGIWNMLAKVATIFDWLSYITIAMDNEGRNTNCWQDLPDINFVDHSAQSNHSAWTCSNTQGSL